MCSSTKEHHSICKNNFCKKTLTSDSAIHSGFCGEKCKKSYILQNALKLSEQYKELGVSLSECIKSKNAKKDKPCRRAGCNNQIKQRRKSSKYCSLECSSAARKKIKVCQNSRCNNLIGGHTLKSTFCSRACYLDSVKPKRKCRRTECSNVVYGGKRVVYCSDECFKLHKRGYIFKDKKCQRSGCDNEIKLRGTKRRFCSHDCYIKEKASHKGALGTITLKATKRDQRKRRYIKTEKGWVLLSKYTWEKEHGSVPKGYFVHIKDGNLFNDQDIDNLELMSFKAILLESRVRKKEPTSKPEGSKSELFKTDFCC